jgi:hypothetical protein
MNYILFDGPYRDNLLPFTFTRPVADIRIGILTIRQKWESYLEYTTTTVTEDYLSEKYPMVEMEENVMINASFLPNPEVVQIIKDLKANQAVFKDEDVIAFFVKEGEEVSDFSNFEAIEFDGEILKIEHTWDIFSKNGEAIVDDYKLLTEGRQSEPIPSNVNVINPEHIFIEKGAKLNFVTQGKRSSNERSFHDFRILSNINWTTTCVQGDKISFGSFFYKYLICVYNIDNRWYCF